MKKLLDEEPGQGREHIVGCAFGPGISIEMAVFRRCALAEGEGSGSTSPVELLKAEPVD